jgi:trimethylamine--corrinoid protein Co-methyltransferase
MSILRPKINVLNEDIKRKIFDEALEILGKLGVFIENQEAKNLLKRQGIEFKGDKYYLPVDLIRKCLKSVPSEIKLYDREGNSYLHLSGDNVYFNPGSAAILFLDETTGDIRGASSQDFIRFTKIVEQMENIEAQSTAIVYQDVPKNAQDWHRLYIALKHCHKPVITGVFRKESFSIMKDLLVSCRLSEKELASKPLAIFDTAPSPPLKWSDLITQSLIDAAKHMIPSEFVSMPLAGANAPITLIGCITQHCAECLAGVVIAQLVNKGAPLIWGSSPAIMDMKFGTTPMGAIETMMINLGNAEMGKFLNFPTHAYMGLSDSKIPDAQGGLEAGMSALLGALAGINVISGPGMLDFESTQSIEKLVIDNQIVGMVKRLIRGISDYGMPFARDILKDYDESQELLSHPTTLQLFKKELLLVSPVIDRMSRESWKNAGGQSTRKRAKEEALKLERKPSLNPIEKNLELELKKIVDSNL